MLYQNKQNEIFNISDLKESIEKAEQQGLIKLTDKQLKAYYNKPLFGVWNGNEWVSDVEKTKQAEYQTWKYERQNKVDNIEVIHNEVVYQGDELSQTRMARAISVMDDDETTQWVAKDNSIHTLNKADLSAILKEAGIKQTLIWNENRPKVGN